MSEVIKRTHSGVYRYEVTSVPVLGPDGSRRLHRKWTYRGKVDPSDPAYLAPLSDPNDPPKKRGSNGAALSAEGALTRDRIIAAIRRLAAAGRPLTAAAIATESGTSHGMLFHYFGSVTAARAAALGQCPTCAGTGFLAPPAPACSLVAEKNRTVLEG